MSTGIFNIDSEDVLKNVSLATMQDGERKEPNSALVESIINYSIVEQLIDLAENHPDDFNLLKSVNASHLGHSVTVLMYIVEKANGGNLFDFTNLNIFIKNIKVVEEKLRNYIQSQGYAKISNKKEYIYNIYAFINTYNRNMNFKISYYNDNITYSDNSHGFLFFKKLVTKDGEGFKVQVMLTPDDLLEKLG